MTVILFILRIYTRIIFIYLLIYLFLYVLNICYLIYSKKKNECKTTKS